MWLTSIVVAPCTKYLTSATNSVLRFFLPHSNLSFKTMFLSLMSEALGCDLQLWTEQPPFKQEITSKLTVGLLYVIMCLYTQTESSQVVFHSLTCLPVFSCFSFKPLQAQVLKRSHSCRGPYPRIDPRLILHWLSACPQIVIQSLLL